MIPLLAALAWADDPPAQDNGNHDDDVFGSPSTPAPEPTSEPTPDAPPAPTAGPTPAPGEPAEPGGDRDSDVLSGGSSKPGMLSTLEALDQRVTIGGRLYLRLNSSIPDDAELQDVTLSNPNLLDLFVDARPNERVRGYVQARLKHDLSLQEGDTDAFGDAVEPTSVLLDQLWLNFDVAHTVFVTVGRQRVKWGAGRFWNPTDFLQPARLDPLAAFDERTGVGLVKFLIPFEKTGTNIYAFADIEGAENIKQVGGALRLEQVIGTTEVALDGSLRKGQPVRLGGQVTTAVGPFDLHAEAAFTHGLKTDFYRGSFDWGPLDDDGNASLFTIETPETYSREDEWIPQVVGGLEIPIKYNDEDSIYIGAEYFYNGAGYEDAKLYPWLVFNNAFTPFYVGQHYAGVYVYVPGPGRLDDHNFTFSTLGNLSDQSYVSRLDYSVRALTFLSINAYAAVHYGDIGELRFGLDVPPILGVTEEAIRISPPLVDLGLGAQISF